jgi:hypothetical protein
MNNSIKFFFIAFIAFIAYSVAANACDITFKVVDNKKDKYEINDVVVVKVTVTLTHRNCSEDIDKTKFVPQGLEIVSATKWSETTNGVYERKLKLKVTGSKKGLSTISASRSCSKEGGYGILKLKLSQDD